MIRYVEGDLGIEPIIAILGESMPREAIGRDRYLRQVILDPNYRAEGHITAIVDGEPAGTLLAVARHVPVEGEMPDPDRGYLWLFGVRPSVRRRGIGTQLLKRGEDYLRSQGRTSIWVSPYSPGYFIPAIDLDAYAEGHAFLLHRGYEEVYRPLAMEASLWDLKEPEWLQAIGAARSAEGVNLHRDASHIALPLLEFARTEFGPDWARFVRESMLRQLSGDRSTGLCVAVEGSTILGFSHFDAERFGPIGVSASQRGRGIGQLLLWDTLRQQRERGYRVSWFLWSDDETARRLYDGAGFREVRRYALLKKAL